MTVTATRPSREQTASGEAGCLPAQVSPDFFDRRTWTWRSGGCVAGMHTFEVLGDVPALAGILEPVTTPLRAHSDPAARTHYRILGRQHEHLPFALYHEGTRLAVAARPERLLRFLTSHINRSMVERTAPQYVVLHAAAARRAGLTVLLPGDQERGKTTTVAGLLRVGYDYITDEAVAIEPTTLQVLPFPKALSIDHGAWSLFPECRPANGIEGLTQWQVPSTSLFSRPVSQLAQRPMVIVFPEFVRDARTRASPLSPGAAVRALVESTFHFPDQTARNLRTLAGVVRGATSMRLVMGSLEEAVDAIDEIVSTALLERLTR